MSGSYTLYVWRWACARVSVCVRVSAATKLHLNVALATSWLKEKSVLALLRDCGEAICQRSAPLVWQTACLAYKRSAPRAAGLVFHRRDLRLVLLCCQSTCVERVQVLVRAETQIDAGICVCTCAIPVFIGVPWFGACRLHAREAYRQLSPRLSVPPSPLPSLPL